MAARSNSIDADNSIFYSRICESFGIKHGYGRLKDIYPLDCEDKCFSISCDPHANMFELLVILGATSLCKILDVLETAAYNYKPSADCIPMVEAAFIYLSSIYKYNNLDPKLLFYGDLSSNISLKERGICFTLNSFVVLDNLYSTIFRTCLKDILLKDEDPADCKHRYEDLLANVAEEANEPTSNILLQKARFMLLDKIEKFQTLFNHQTRHSAI